MDDLNPRCQFPLHPMRMPLEGYIEFHLNKGQL